MKNVISLQDARVNLEQRNYKRHIRSLDNQGLEVEATKVIDLEDRGVDKGLDIMSELSERTFLGISEKIRLMRERIENSLERI